MKYPPHFREEVLKIKARKKLSTRETAARFGISEWTIKVWCNTPALKGGESLEKSEQDIQEHHDFSQHGQVERPEAPGSTIFTALRQGNVSIYRGKMNLEELQQDVDIHPDATQQERADRLGVPRGTVAYALKKLSIPSKLPKPQLPSPTKHLYSCIGAWLSNPPQGESSGRKLLVLRVMQVYEEKSSHLDLSRLNLGSLPMEIFEQLLWLKTLNLRDNFLITLAGSEIAKLKQLQWLDLSNNLLTDLEGSGINELRELLYLDLSNNLLINASELCGLRQLQILNLANNPNLTPMSPKDLPCSGGYDLSVNGQSQIKLSSDVAGSMVGYEDVLGNLPETISPELFSSDNYAKSSRLRPLPPEVFARSLDKTEVVGPRL